MLRRPLSRPLLLRPLSTSSSRWNVQRPPAFDVHAKAEPSKAEPYIQEPVQDTRPESPDTPFASDPVKTRSSDSREPLSPYDLDLVKQRIREWTEQAIISLRNRADDFTANTKTTFSQLGSHLNKVTGYEEIEALKRGVVEQENRINAARQAARKAKTAYEQAVIQRSNSQREVNDLLQRKSTWSDGDVGRFTTLVRQDHLYEQEESRAKAAVDETENAVDKEFSQLMRTILARYHEEQVWSDKIRSASTYGSLAALGLNMLVFIMAIIVVEPWKRRRLAQTFERKIEQLSAENEARLDVSMQVIGGQIVRQESLLEDLKEEISRQIIEVAAEAKREVAKDKIQETISAILIPPAQPSRWQLEMVAVGAAAFAAGILSTVIFSR